VSAGVPRAAVPAVRVDPDGADVFVAELIAEALFTAAGGGVFLVRDGPEAFSAMP
jgi:hypothetical protein